MSLLVGLKEAQVQVPLHLTFFMFSKHALFYYNISINVKADCK